MALRRADKPRAYAVPIVVDGVQRTSPLYFAHSLEEAVKMAMDDGLSIAWWFRRDGQKPSELLIF